MPLPLLHLHQRQLQRSHFLQSWTKLIWVHIVGLFEHHIYPSLLINWGRSSLARRSMSSRLMGHLLILSSVQTIAHGPDHAQHNSTISVSFSQKLMMLLLWQMTSVCRQTTHPIQCQRPNFPYPTYAGNKFATVRHSYALETSIYNMNYELCKLQKKNVSEKTFG